MATSADARGWGPGYPHCQSGLMVPAHGGGIVLTVRREVAPMVSFLCDATVHLGYNLATEADDWGFACRAIRGYPSVPSNHSWGLAVDLNANRNPMAATLVTNMPPSVVALWEAFGWRWGGRYSGRKDSMHYEFVGTPADAARLASDIANLLRSGPVAPPPPDLPLLVRRPLLQRGMTGPDVAAAKFTLACVGYCQWFGLQDAASQAVFGDYTTGEVQRLQREWNNALEWGGEGRSLAEDGIVGPQTWDVVSFLVNAAQR